MSPVDLVAVSLFLSIGVALLGWGVLRLAGRHIADPSVRERAWAAILYVPAAPPLIVAVACLLPPQVRRVSITAEAAVQAAAPAGAGPSDPLAALLSVVQNAAAPAFLALAVLVSILGLLALAVRTLRLLRLIRASAPAASGLSSEVERQARRMKVRAPEVRVAGSAAEPLLAGLFRPVLVVPAALAARPHEPAARAVCAHELAHLRRGDHRALWIEELLLAVLAINPVLRILRRHRADAREEACDAMALAGSDPVARRLYARALVDALKRPARHASAPALTFTPRRTFVMHRLKAILSPAAPAGSRARLSTVGLAALVVGVAGAGSLAIAGQRQPVSVVADEPPAAALAARPAPAATPTPSDMTTPRPAVASRPIAPLVERSGPDATPAPPAAVAPAVPVAAATPRPAQTPVADGSRPAVISAPQWMQLPMPSYPAGAVAANISEGRVRLSCVAEADGHVSGCSVIDETPVGAGFGAAAVEAMKDARLSPATVDSAAPGARVTFTIRFRI